ncbi:hypothetical protein BX666DRAFT_274634 [Dichotomocladium elegans]|nr:hypothetical protein BX666DRAFT_274634 [Dichotomocladium elegans]
MAIFRFRKKKADATVLSTLRKTKSTGNIVEATTVLSKPILVKEPANGLKQEPIMAREEKRATLTAPVTVMMTDTTLTNSHKNTESSDSEGSNSSSSSSSSSCSSSEDESDTKSVSSLPAAITPAPEKPRSKNIPQPMVIPHVGPIVKSNSSPCTPSEVTRSANGFFSSDDLELLLSQETEARIEAQEKKAAEAKPVRQTRLKFALPETPPRSRSPAYSAYSRPRQRWSMPDEKALQHQQQQQQNAQRKKKASRRSRWTKIMGGESSEDEDPDESQRPFAVGDKVRLLHRPLPILGYIRYMGPVHFAEGDNWVGVELDNRGKKLKDEGKFGSQGGV